MKKILLIFFLLISVSSSAYASEEEHQDGASSSGEEIFLETQINLMEPAEDTNAEDLTEILHEKTLAERLKEVYNLEIERTDIAIPLSNDVTTFRFEKGPLKSFHPWFAMQSHGRYELNEGDDDDLFYKIGIININLDGVLKSGEEDFRLMLNVTPQSQRPFMKNFVQDAYIATNRIPHHRIILGNTRPAVGYEGSQSPYTLPFINRSQIARNFGTVRKFGLRIVGNYDFVDYDLGALSSDTFFSSFFPGAEFDGWVNFKPLAKTDGKYGKLVTGGGITAGKRDTDFFVAGAYAGYEYKKFTTRFEWAHSNGSNGLAGLTTNKATGFYSTVAYKITPKVQILFRYDEFDPDTDVARNKSREYTTGINYFIKGQAVKLMLNYIFCQNQNRSDSHKILVGTQFLL